MTGYSGTPLTKKLGIKAAHRVLLLDAPEGFETMLEGLPEQVTLVRSARGKGPYDVLVAFVTAKTELDRKLPALREKLKGTGGLWFAWPKKSSGVKTDVTEDVVRATGLAIGLVDNKVCAIDDTWSGLRLVVRVKDRK